MEDIFFKHKGRYKHRRINLELRKSGVVVSEKRAVRIMREKGLQAKAITRRYRIQKRIEAGDPRINLVEQAFTVFSKNRL